MTPMNDLCDRDEEDRNAATESGGHGSARYDVAVVTTAALPWRTGPAFFSLWHAGGLKALGYRVVYVVPWVPPNGQRLWGGPIHRSFAAQAAAMRQEAKDLGVPPLPDIVSYRGSVWPVLRSIVPLQDIFRATPRSRAIVLHEPEHLTWPHWTVRRRKVDAEKIVGIIMTNSEDYARRALPGPMKGIAYLVKGIHQRRVARHTDVAVPLSGACAHIAGPAQLRRAQVTGVVAHFFDVPPVGDRTRGVYFLGRLVWDKGLDEVISLSRRMGLAVDIVGDGPDAAAIRAKAERVGAPLRFLGPSARPWILLEDYRVFLNPSRSEVLCTATAEALVAGRHVVLAECPANDPFRNYPNAHFFKGEDEAVTALRYALSAPLAPPTAVREAFDWMNACRTVASLCELEERSPNGA